MNRFNSSLDHHDYAKEETLLDIEKLLAKGFGTANVQVQDKSQGLSLQVSDIHHRYGTEFPSAQMTSNSTLLQEGLYVSASSSHEGANDSFRAFDKQENTQWRTLSGKYDNITGEYTGSENLTGDVLGEYITIQFPVAVEISEVRLENVQNTPGEALFYRYVASKDGVNWFKFGAPGGTVFQDFYADHPPAVGFFKHYGIIVTEVQPGATFAQLHNVRWFGHFAKLVTYHNLELSRNGIQDKRSVSIIGFNDAVGTTLEDIGFNGNFFASTGAATLETNALDANDINTTGAGARQVQITGLDGSLNEVTEIINVGGAVTSTSFIRVNKVDVIEVGTYGAANFGNIEIRENISMNVKTVIGGNGATGNAAYGHSTTTDARYSVSQNKIAFITRIEVNVEGATCSVFCMSRENLNVTSNPFSPKIVKWRSPPMTNTNIVTSLESYIPITSKSDVWFQGLSTGTSQVTVSFDLILVDVPN